MESHVRAFFDYVENDDIELVRDMIDFGFDPNEIDDSGNTVLHITNSIDMINFLVENGAHVNCLGNCRRPPLHGKIIAKHPSLEAIKCLVKNGADVNMQDTLRQTALHLAVGSENSLEIIKYLIEAGADLNILDGSGCTPLDRAFIAGNFEAFEYLVKSGADHSINNVKNRHVYNNKYSVRESNIRMRQILETYKLLHTYSNLWNVDPDKFTLFFQWLPEEVCDDVMSLITGESESLRSFLYTK